MKYTVEDVSPVEKKVLVEVEPENVNATIMATAELYKDVQLRGYRKGKVPRAMIEQKYKKNIYAEAREDIVNIKLNELLATEKFQPIGPLHVFDESPLERDKPFSFTFQFEVLPQPETPLPNYEGLSVQIPHAKPEPNFLKDSIERIRQANKTIITIQDKGPATDGQIVNLDYSFSENGQELPQYTVKKYDFELSPKAFLPSMYDLIRSAKVGEVKTGEVHFPENFIDKELAGKTLSIKLKVNVIRKVVLPEINDDWCKRNKFGSVQQLEEMLRRSEERNLRLTEKRAAEFALAAQILKTIDIPLSPFYNKRILDDYVRRTELRANRMGYILENPDAVREKFKLDAEFETRVLVLYLLIAKKENLSVSDREVEEAILAEARENQIDFSTLRKEYERTGEIFSIRDHMLANKGAKVVYERSKVTFIEKTDAPSQGETEQKAQETEAGQPGQESNQGQTEGVEQAADVPVVEETAEGQAEKQAEGQPEKNGDETAGTGSPA